MSPTPTITISPTLAAALSPTATVTRHTTVFLPTTATGFRPQPSLLGVALEGYRDDFGFNRALELGVRWMRRTQAISWRDIEPREGEYHWETLTILEQELLQARENGVEPIITVQMTPDWAQGVVPYACGPIRADKFEAFGHFMEQLVTRFGMTSPSRVRYWQIANEPDVAPGEVGPESVFGCWGDPNDPYYGGGYFAEMMKVVYSHVKATDPNAQVMLAGLLLECDPQNTEPGNGCINAQRWKSGLFLEGVMRAGGGAYFDIAAVHSYAALRMDLPQRMHSYYNWSAATDGGTGLPEKVDFVRRVLTAYGYGTKPVYAGEIALKCDDPTPECYEVGAAFVLRAYAEAYGLKLVGATYYALISEFKYKGLLLPDSTPKPAFWAYKFLSSKLAGASYDKPVKGHPGVSGHNFRYADGRQFLIVWSSDGADHTVPVPDTFERAYDKYGDPVAPTGNLLTISWSPIYVAVR